MKAPKQSTAVRIVGFGTVGTAAINILGIPGMLDDAAAWGRWIAALHLELWGWWALAFAGAALVYWSYRAERPSEVPTFDTPLREFVAGRLGLHKSVFDDDDETDVSTHINDIYEALAEVRERALNGHITVWARHMDMPPMFADLDIFPRAPIDRSEWSDREIDALEFMQDPRGALKEGHVGAKHYHDIWLYSRDIKRWWPPTKKRIQFRLPWVTADA